MRPKYRYLISFTVFCIGLTLAQKKSNNDLVLAYKTHFKTHREQVYLNLNKDHFISGEQIFFTAFVFNQQTSIPRDVPTNLYVGLYDSQGLQLEKTMWPVIDGVASGNFDVSAEYKHGIYYLKAETRWMKNFHAYAPAIKSIRIIEYDWQREDNNSNHFNLHIRAEGGNPVSGIINTIGFQVTNESRSGIEIKGGRVLDAKGAVVLDNLRSNKFGYGKFDIFLEERKEYFCELLTKEDQVLRKRIPPSKSDGFALNVTGNALRRIITVRANPNSYTENRNKRFALIIHRNGKIQETSFVLNAPSKSFSLAKANLLEGANIVTLLNGEGGVLCERIIYNAPQIIENELQSKISKHPASNDSLFLDVKLKKSRKTKVILSLSIMADESVNLSHKESIHESLLLRPFANKNAEFSNWLYQTSSNKLFMDLDLLMLVHGRSNFSWTLLNAENQILDHPVENGISVKGQIKNKNLDKIKSVLMYQDNIEDMKFAEIDDEGNFFISNALIKKERRVNFSLMNVKDKLEKPELDVTFSPKIPIDSLDVSQLNPNTESLNSDRVIPTNLNSWIENKRSNYLDEIVLTAKTTKEEPSRNENLTGGFWSAEKISEEDIVRKRSLSNYLRSLGFKVRTHGPTGWLFVQARRSGNPMIRPPTIYLDGFRLNGGLPDYQLHNIDEVYYEHAGLMESNGGTIFIYLRQGDIISTQNKNQFTSLIASEGFNDPTEFVNFIDKESVDSIFRKYGCVHWEPQVIIIDNGEARIKFKDLGLDRYKVYIEGISTDGTLYSKVEVVELSKY